MVASDALVKVDRVAHKPVAGLKNRWLSPFSRPHFPIFPFSPSPFSPFSQLSIWRRNYSVGCEPIIRSGLGPGQTDKRSCNETPSRESLGVKSTPAPLGIAPIIMTTLLCWLCSRLTLILRLAHTRCFGARKMKPQKGFYPVILWSIVLYVTSLIPAYTTGYITDNTTWGVLSGLAWMLVGVTPASPLGRFSYVSVGHLGLLLHFGERKRDTILTEGMYWIPPLSSIMEFDARERRMEISAGEALSSDSITIQLTAQFRVRVVDAYLHSDVQEPEETLREHARDACRAHIASRSALEVATNGTFTEELHLELRQRAADLGMSVGPVAISEIRLPPDLERFSQVLRIIRTQHSGITFQQALDAIQTDRANVRKVVLESATVDSAVEKLSKVLATTVGN